MAKPNATTETLIARLQAWLEPLNDYPVECDGMTRVIQHLLKKHGIEHKTMAGYLGNLKLMNDQSVGDGEIAGCSHWWIELPTGHYVDLRARMWMGETAQHGVFMLDATEFDYLNAHQCDLGDLPTYILNVMIGRDISDYPGLDFTAAEVDALNNPRKVKKEVDEPGLAP